MTPKQKSSLRLSQFREDLDEQISILRKVHQEAMNCECQGRAEIYSALKLALGLKELLITESAEAQKLNWSMFIPALAFIARFAMQLVSSSNSNNYKFPENYEYRVYYTAA